MKEILIINGLAATSLESPPIDLGDLRDYSVHAVFSAAIAGVLELKASNYRETGYVPINHGSVEVTNMDFLFNVQFANYRYLKVSWTPTSGAGTLKVQFILKEFYVKEG